MRILLGFVACAQRNQAELRTPKKFPYRGLRKQRRRQPRSSACAAPGPPGKWRCEHCSAGTAAHRCGGRIVADGAQPGCPHSGGWQDSGSLTSTRHGLELTWIYYRSPMVKLRHGSCPGQRLWLSGLCLKRGALSLARRRAGRSGWPGPFLPVRQAGRRAGLHRWIALRASWPRPSQPLRRAGLPRP
jgi:hypothetical protein